MLDRTESPVAPGGIVVPAEIRRPLTFTVPEPLWRTLDQLDQQGTDVARLVESTLRQVVDDALQPHKRQLVDRLLRERGERRGPAFDIGLCEGMRWSIEVASLKELVHYTHLVEKSVRIGVSRFQHRRRYGGPPRMAFRRSFRAPKDYLEAPDPGSEVGLSEEHWEEFWRGWLKGVLNVAMWAHESIKGSFASHPLDHVRGDPDETAAAVWEVSNWLQKRSSGRVHPGQLMVEMGAPVALAWGVATWSDRRLDARGETSLSPSRQETAPFIAPL